MRWLSCERVASSDITSSSRLETLAGNAAQECLLSARCARNGLDAGVGGGLDLEGTSCLFRSQLLLQREVNIARPHDRSFDQIAVICACDLNDVGEIRPSGRMQSRSETGRSCGKFGCDVGDRNWETVEPGGFDAIDPFIVLADHAPEKCLPRNPKSS
jgi:hypothetical protein